MKRMIGAALLVAAGLLVEVGVQAQLPPLSPAHLNPAIAKLVAGQPIYGVITQDISRENARTLGRRDTDFVFVDMEHSPFNMEAFANFAANIADRAWTAKNGLAPRNALIVRMPPYASENAAWLVKQALDIGAMGFVFNTVETAEEAENAVKSMRYAPWKAHPNTFKGPVGIRGFSPGGAVWLWGVAMDEYRRRADVWPLNPEGDLMAIMIIETAKGVDNVDAIAAVPGVTALSVAAGADLSSSYGVPGNAPEIEAARQKVLQACLKHNVVCWVSPTGKADQDRRLKEGWRMIRTASGQPFQ
ncbi:MAG: HpcH/HpaI aldolase/citrate lyase family protein [Vicinamibacterales bacterium]